MDVEDFDYFLPQNNLALEPAVLRDSSKLFVYDTKTDKITFDRFFNLPKHLPKDSFLVLNNTKVLPARMTMKKESGGKVVILFLVNEQTQIHVISGIVDRKINVGEKIFFEDRNFIKVVGQKENIFEFQFNFSKEKLFALLQEFGNMPIPPYLKKSSLTRDELMKKYQTIFAKSTPVGCGLASAAAPTASLHFTDDVFSKLNEKGIEKYFITLHVGLGTFAPITNENIKQKKLHEEYFEIDKSTVQSINRLKKEGKKLVAVGTTVVRTLESNAQHRVFSTATPQWGPWRFSQKQVFSLSKTNLFIFPPYDFKMVDVMITNFHLPKSSLMMLVEAFLQYKYKKSPPSSRLRRAKKKSLIELYNIAIKNNFRFYSFGDAMIIL